MPNRDGTGPQGQGRPGRGQGPCVQGGQAGRDVQPDQGEPADRAGRQGRGQGGRGACRRQGGQGRNS